LKIKSTTEARRHGNFHIAPPFGSAPGLRQCGCVLPFNYPALALASLCSARAAYRAILIRAFRRCSPAWEKASSVPIAFSREARNTDENTRLPRVR